MASLHATAKEKTDTSSVELNEKQPGIPNVTWQHVWPYDQSRNALSESSFAAIPDEILIRIFQLLSVPDLCNVSLLCRCFKMIVDQDDIWKLKCNSSTKLYSKSFKQIYMEWMYEKCLRNIKLRDFDRRWHRTGCLMVLPPAYPLRPMGKHQFKPIGGFLEHPNSSPDMTIKLSVDIDNTARELIKLLEKASAFQEKWQQPLILKQMITRYYRFMQLKAFHPPNILMIPTLDIEIVWQTHLLRPEMYQADCLRLFRRVIDHSLLATDIQQFFKEQAFIDTCQLYDQQFDEQYCPLPSTDVKNGDASNASSRRYTSYDKVRPTYAYWDKTYFEFSSQPPKNYENPFSFTESDIILDINWLDLCKKFMSNAAKKVPIDDDDFRSASRAMHFNSGAMKRLKKSYERFLYMAVKYPLNDGSGFIPPTYAMDIMWHSHMQEPLNYASDCLRLVGYVIFHAPWPIIEDNTMKKTCDATDDIWKQEFESDITTDHLYNTINTNADWLNYNN